MARSNEYVLRKTLELINELRSDFDLKPIKRIPKGRRESPQRCPAALGLSSGSNMAVSVHLACIDFDSRECNLIAMQRLGTHKAIGLIRGIRNYPASPPEMQDFVRRFDAGKFPELVGS